MEKGVRIPCPESVYIGKDVRSERISGKNVVLHPGSRITGNDTLILHGARIGNEGPAVIENCFIGPEVSLGGGFFRESVFLKGAGLGSGAHVREGTILEEGARAAHTVGLKQTILFPFVTLGSLINFCDCLMAGGTGRGNHSEVGSSYIHFNYTPMQDKATPSLIGDVPKGVMLDQPAVFLGGQGGLVGPCRLAFGTTVAAGTICRKDELRPGRLIYGGASKAGNISYMPGPPQGRKRIFKNNFIYIASLVALREWYLKIRARFISEDFPEPLLEGLTSRIEMGVRERLRQLEKFVTLLSDRAGSPESAAQWSVVNAFIENCLESEVGNAEDLENFLKWIDDSIQREGKDYIRSIRSLEEETRNLGSSWLQGIVDHISNQAMDQFAGIL